MFIKGKNICRLRPPIITSANPRYGNQIARRKQAAGFYVTANGLIFALK